MASNQSDYRNYDLREPDRRSNRSNSVQPPPGDTYPPRQQSRSRASSTAEAQPALHHPQPRPQTVKETLNVAPVTNNSAPQISQELVAAITEQVLQSLVPKLSGLTTAPPPPPPPTAFKTTTDGSQAVPPRDVYTPPSPAKYNPPTFTPIVPDFRDYQLDGHVDKEPQTMRFTERPIDRPQERSITPPPQSANTDHSRPKAPLRISTGDTTTLEKIWQPLFEGDGEPTARLGQFLRGLAMHIIDDFEPKHSLVITPLKMLKFYYAVKLSDEIYPWHIIFGGRMSNSSISHMYRDLKCQHHFVQAVALDERPSVPALTPDGFQCWMTHMIRAHPETEYRRFAEAVLTMPINNADNVKERFPKELSRRLFPKNHDSNILMAVEDAIYADPVTDLTHTTSASSTASQSGPSAAAPASSSQQTIRPPQSPTSKTVPVPPVPSTTENGRNPPSQSSSEVAVEEIHPHVSIERERQPYYAQPGGGKIYDNEGPRSEELHKRSNSTGHSFRPEPTEVQDEYGDSAPLKQVRTNSTAMPAPPPPRVHGRRHRSPSMSTQNNSYGKAEGDGYSSNYNTYSTQQVAGTGPNAATEGDEDERRKYKIRYSNEESEPRGYSTGGARAGYSSSDEQRYTRGRRGSTMQSSAGSGYSYGGGAAPPRY